MQSAIVVVDDLGSQLSHWLVSPVLRQFLVTFVFPITSTATKSYRERKIWAWMQDRIGPSTSAPT